LVNEWCTHISVNCVWFYNLLYMYSGFRLCVNLDKILFNGLIVWVNYENIIVFRTLSINHDCITFTVERFHITAPPIVKRFHTMTILRFTVQKFHISVQHNCKMVSHWLYYRLLSKGFTLQLRTAYCKMVSYYMQTMTIYLCNIVMYSFDHIYLFSTR